MATLTTNQRLHRILTILGGHHLSALADGQELDKTLDLMEAAAIALRERNTEQASQMVLQDEEWSKRVPNTVNVYRYGRKEVHYHTMRKEASQYIMRRSPLAGGDWRGELFDRMLPNIYLHVCFTEIDRGAVLEMNATLGTVFLR